MKRQCLIFKVLTLVLIFSVIGLAGAVAKEYTFGVVNVNAIYPYYQAEILGMQKMADRLGVKLLVLDSQGDPGIQMSNVETLIAKRVDMILLINVGQTDGGMAVRRASAAKIPTIAVSRLCKGGDPISSVITDKSAATAAADFFTDEVCKGKGKVAEVQGMPGVSNVILRHEALMEALQRNPGITLLQSAIGNFDPAVAQNVAADILASNPDLEAFYVHNDGMAMGVIKAVAAVGKTGKVKILGIDGEPDAIVAIKAGKMTATSGVPVALEGARAVHYGYQYLQGKKIPEYVATPVINIDDRNIHRFAGDPKYLWENIDWPEYPFE
jgi:ABC-type sugar transport system substrate-binding protein